MRKTAERMQMKKILSLVLVLILASLAFADSDSVEDYSEDELVQQYAEEESSADVTTEVEEISGESEADIASELELSSEETAEIEEAETKHGLGPYVRSLQLKERMTLHIIQAESVITAVGANATGVANLSAIISEMKVFTNGINPKEMSQEDFVSAIAKAKELVKKFRESVRGMTTEDQRAQIRLKLKELRPEVRSEFKELKELEHKARLYANRKLFKRVFKDLEDELKEVQKDNEKLLVLRSRIEQLKDLREKSISDDLTEDERDEIRDDWREKRKEYLQDKDNLPVLNARARLAFQAQEIRKAVIALKADGEDISELEAQLAEIEVQIREVSPGSMTGEDAKDRVRLIEARIKALREADSKLEDGMKKLEDNRRFMKIIKGSGSTDSTARRERIRDAKIRVRTDDGSSETEIEIESESETEIEIETEIENETGSERDDS